MTEIPEHLLQRSRERRAALGLDTGTAPAPAAEAAPAAAVEPAAATAPAVPAPTRPATPAPAPAPPPPPPPDPPYIAAAKNRRRIPWWAMPVLAGLPLWAGLYAFTLEEPGAGAADPLALGQDLFEANSASCHGAQGEGGAGPSFQDGAVVETWPNWRDHIAWVELGSQGWPTDTYGDVQKPVGGVGNMPAFGETLEAGEIAMVVRYEREVLAGAEPEEDLVALTTAIAAGAAETETGENVEETLAEAGTPGDGPGGTRPPPEG